MFVKDYVDTINSYVGNSVHDLAMDDIDPKLGYGQKLRQLRKHRGLKQADVAVAVGVARPTLSGIETGKSSTSRATLIAAADFYKVSLDWLTSAPSSPDRRDLVDDADELALLDMWREFDDGERALALRILKGIDGPDTR